MPQSSFAQYTSARPLDEVLGDIIDHTNLNLLYDANLVADKTSTCKVAEMNDMARLSCILEDTGLELRRLESGTYTLAEAKEVVPTSGDLVGQVFDQSTGLPVADVNVVIEALQRGTASDAFGRFAFSGLEPGRHRVVATHISYVSEIRLETIKAGSADEVGIAMSPRVSVTAPLIVDATLNQPISVSLGTASRDAIDIRQMTARASADPLSSLDQVVGVTIGDALADVHVQGGAAGDHQHRLDGATVFVPIRNGGVFGPFSPYAIDQITVHKAGFGAPVGSQLGGVIDISHQLGAGPPTATVQVDQTSMNGRAAGSSMVGESTRLDWMAAGRASMWTLLQPSGLQDRFKSWSAPDTFLLKELDPEEAGKLDYARLVTSDPEIGFSDIHAAARLYMGGGNLNVSFYNGRNSFGNAALAQLEIIDEIAADEYTWDNRVVQVRYEWVQDKNSFFEVGAWSSQYRMDNPLDATGLPGFEITFLEDRDPTLNSEDDSGFRLSDGGPKDKERRRNSGQGDDNPEDDDFDDDEDDDLKDDDSGDDDSGDDDSGDDDSGDDDSGDDDSGEDNSGGDDSGEDDSEDDDSGEDNSGDDDSGGDDNSGDDDSGEDDSEDDDSGEDDSGDDDSGDDDSGDDDSGDDDSGDDDSGDDDSGDDDSGDDDSGDDDSEDDDSGEDNSGDDDSGGDDNSGDDDSGEDDSGDDDSGDDDSGDDDSGDDDSEEDDSGDDDSEEDEEDSEDNTSGKNGDEQDSSPDEERRLSNFNQVREYGFRAGFDETLSDAHRLKGGLETVYMVSDFRLLLDPIGEGILLTTEDINPVRWRVQTFLEDEVTVSSRTNFTVGSRVTYVPGLRAIFLEPRLALRHEIPWSATGAWGFRAAGGIYHQFVDQFDVAPYNAAGLIPSYRFWIPVAAGQRPSKAYHLSFSSIYSPARRWSFNFETYYKYHPVLRLIDYGSLEDERPNGITEGKGYSVGAAVGLALHLSRARVEAKYEWNKSRRSVENRFDGRSVPTPWEAPHTSSFLFDFRATRSLTLTARWKGMWARTWGFRRSYYDYLASRSGSQSYGGFDLTQPENHVLPAFVQLDLGIAYSFRWDPIRIQARANFVNVLDRSNVTEWELLAVGGGTDYTVRSRLSTPFLPILSLRVSN